MRDHPHRAPYQRRYGSRPSPDAPPENNRSLRPGRGKAARPLPSPRRVAVRGHGKDRRFYRRFPQHQRSLAVAIQFSDSGELPPGHRTPMSTVIYTSRVQWYSRLVVFVASDEDRRHRRRRFETAKLPWKERYLHQKTHSDIYTRTLSVHMRLRLDGGASCTN